MCGDGPLDGHGAENARGHRGTGPGAITPDGCAVELYARLPVGAEPDIVAAAVPRGARILELGCGVGRMTHPLLERGFTVTAVDESAEMLERVRGARTIRSAIEDLDLGERFDAVLLASFLVHTGDTEVRRGLLRTCARHLTDDGCVLIQREGADYHTDLPRERSTPAASPCGSCHPSRSATVSTRCTRSTSSRTPSGRRPSGPGR